MYKKELAAKNAHWKKVVADFESSGMSQIAYSKEHGIAHHKLSYYRQKLKEKNSKELVQKPSAFTPVIPKEKVVKKNISSDIIDPKWLAELIRELHARS